MVLYSLCEANPKNMYFPVKDCDKLATGVSPSWMYCSLSNLSFTNELIFTLPSSDPDIML